MMKILKMMCVLSLVLMTGCYAMPRGDEYSVVPSTNNPDYTGRVPSAMPQMPGGAGGF